MSDDVIGRLAETIRARRQSDGGSSYTKQLLDAGPARCARKLGEEAIELVIAGVAQDDSAVVAEAGDVIYHLLVLLEARGIGFDAVSMALQARMKMSGLAEKAARTGGP